MFVKNGSIYIKPRPKWSSAHSTESYDTFHQRNRFVFVIPEGRMSQRWAVTWPCTYLSNLKVGPRLLSAVVHPTVKRFSSKCVVFLKYNTAYNLRQFCWQKCQDVIVCRQRATKYTTLPLPHRTVKAMRSYTYLLDNLLFHINERAWFLRPCIITRSQHQSHAIRLSHSLQFNIGLSVRRCSCD